MRVALSPKRGQEGDESNRTKSNRKEEKWKECNEVVVRDKRAEER